MTPSDAAPILTREEAKELLDRMRRMETRMVKFMEAQGFAVDKSKPSVAGTVVTIPSTACSVRDILTVLDATDSGPGPHVVEHAGERLFMMQAIPR